MTLKESSICHHSERNALLPPSGRVLNLITSTTPAHCRCFLRMAWSQRYRWTDVWLFVVNTKCLWMSLWLTLITTFSLWLRICFLIFHALFLIIYIEVHTNHHCLLVPPCRRWSSCAWSVSRLTSSSVRLGLVTALLLTELGAPVLNGRKVT